MSTSWLDAKRILCVRLDGLGDVLMATPAVRALRNSAGRHITLLASAAGASIAALIPEVDEVLEYAAPWMKASPPRMTGRSDDFALVERLASSGFDGAVIFTTYTQSPLPAALMAYLAGIPLRLAHCHENPYQLLTDWVRDDETAGASVRHEARRQLDLVASIGASTDDEHLSLRVPDTAVERVAARLKATGIDARQAFAVVHPGASAPSRRYAPQRLASAADFIAQRTGLTIVVVGGQADLQAVERVRCNMRQPCVVLADNLDLAELAALIASAALLVCNNSGPAHIAAAVGTPVVDLYALTNPQHTPWQVASRVLSHDVPCRNCLRSVCPHAHHACLQSIPPSAVADAACELLAACA